MLANSTEERKNLCHTLRVIRRYKKANGEYMEWLKAEMTAKRFVRAQQKSFSEMFYDMYCRGVEK
jgi:hypothetical protein